MKVRTYVEFGRTCYICGAPADTVDHVVPLARGGSTNITNLRPACRKCNEDKGDTPLDEFLAGAS